MKVFHKSWPVGTRTESTIRLACPYSITLHWRWREKFHSLDAVLYGELREVGHE
jgi:hypothetical protein